jgi:hypothetical protein
VTQDELIIPLQTLISKHEKWEKYRSAKKQNNSGKRVIKHNGIQQKSTKKEEGLPEGKKLLFIRKGRDFQARNLDVSFKWLV